MSLSSAEIRNIVETLQKSGWDQAVVTVGDVQISVARNGATLAGTAAVPPQLSTTSPVPLASVEASVTPGEAPLPIVSVGVAPAVATASNAPEPEGHIVGAPSVGVFWSASEPGAAPFVSVGQSVQPGDTLCIIEIMKLMNNVTADVAGEVVAIHATNASSVEYGTALFTIRLKE